MDPHKLKKDFPILSREIRGKPLVFLDNGASTQKPSSVIDAMGQFYQHTYANVHRGAYTLSEEATNAFENVRKRVAQFLGAQTKEIVFTRGATESINLVAQTFGRANVKAGDEIIISAMEHHANIVPWQMLCEEKGAQLKVIPMDERGVLKIDALSSMLSSKVKLLAIAHVSNSLGTVNPVKEIIRLVQEKNIPVLIDGAQAVPHIKVNVNELGCDFYVFSSHKIYGPTGIGVLYGKFSRLDTMPPWQGGGDMIASVSFEKTTYNSVPFKFEAGTPSIVEAIGLHKALDYVENIGLDSIAAHEHRLLELATEQVSKISGVKIVGTAPDKSAILSFVIEGVHPHDVATILDSEGVAVRAGHHCAQPVMDFFKVPATARASFALYNTEADVDALVKGILKVKEIFNV